MLITPAYVEEQHLLHQDPNYGAGGHRYAYLVAGIMWLESCHNVLDYGAGKGTLANELPDFKLTEYDPGVPGKDKAPEPVDLVVCIDVMEHIEPDCLDDVIKHLVSLARRRLFVDVATKFDKGRTLSDGRNAHMQAKDGDWWAAKFKSYGFKIQRVWDTGGLKAWVALMEVANGNR